MSTLPWPGNVRELQNLVRRLTVFASSDRIDLHLVHKVMTNASSGAPSFSERNNFV